MKGGTFVQELRGGPQGRLCETAPSVHREECEGTRD